MADIEFGEDLELLSKTAADLMRDRSTFDAVRASAASDDGYDHALFSQLADLGFLGVALPETHGGAALDAGALVAIVEPMGRHLYSSPFLATTLAGQLLARQGSAPDRAAHLPGIASGKTIGTVALNEPDGAYEPATLGTVAEPNGGQYAITGTKTGVLDASHADVLLVAANCHGSPGVLAVERDALPQGAIERERLVDETRRTYRVTFDGSRATRIGGDAGDSLRYLNQLGALLMAADMSGGTLGVIELTIDYLQTRTQFGKPIGGYQALKHPMVDIFVASEQGRSLLYHAATVFDGTSTASERAVRMAKVHCGRTFTHAADRSIQFHGAIGFTYECHAQLFLRRAQWSEYQFGDCRHHKRRLQPLVLENAE